MRRVRMMGLALLTAGVLAAACSNHAGASTLTSGAVTLTATSPANATTPWGSGQVIEVTVAPNSTLSLSNLESQGGLTGEPAMKVEECDDPDGSVAKLPTVPMFHCDGSTILSTSYINKDGSFLLKNYAIYALPDSVTLGESSDGVPKCGTAPNYCVLYVGPNQLDFAKPHLFSAPFLVTSNSTDKPTAIGSASTTGTATASVSLSASSGSAAQTGSAGTGGGSTLAFTGPFPATPWLVVLGLAMIVVGTIGRRRQRSVVMP